MNLDELESFKLSDSVKFHDKLNPALWTEKGKLDAEVENKLMEIAKDFMAELGLSSLKVDDITISGSNAAYSYTPHSDLDLHILVDYNKLPDNEVYKELFNAKKTVYNDTHNIKVHGVPVELYVQDTNQPHTSLGEYSLLKKEWIKFPVKRRANFDQTATRLKYEKLGELIELAIKQRSLAKVEKVLDIIKRYRKAGLNKTGEFGPENLAFKAIRKQGLFQKLFDLKNELHSRELSIEDYDPNGPPPGPEFPPTMPQGTIRVDVSDVYDWYKLGQHISNMKGLGKHDFGKGPPSTILSFGDEDLEHQYIDALKKTGLDTTDIDPKAHDTKKGQKVDPTYNVNEILDKESAAKIYWSQDNYMTGGRVNQNFTLHTAAAQDKNKNILKYNFYDFPKYSLTAVEFSRAVGPWGDNFSIDNAGDQYTVFATLIKTFTEYLSKHKPKYIMFGAKEPSRAKLYQTFVNRFASKFGYKQINPDSIPKPVSAMILNSGDTPFLLARTDLVKESVKFIEGTNCKNCIWWKKDSEKPVGKDELNKYGGLKPPNKEYIAMSKRVDLVTLPGKDTVKEKGFCYHKDINDWVTERMCCAKWDGKGVIRDYKGESPLMEVLDTQPNKTNKAIWDFSDPSMIQLNFVASNGQPYLLDFLEPHLAPDEINQYELLPDSSDKYLDRGYFVQFEQKIKRSPWKQGKQGIEGTGAAAEVFGIVTNAILQFVKKKKPTYLYFQAAESNRVSLYSAMIKKILPSLPGWKANGPSSDGVFMLYSPVKKNVTKEDGQKGKFVYHVTPTKNLQSIAKNGLTPNLGDRSNKISGEVKGIYVFPDKVSAEDAVMNWLGDEFEDEHLTMLKIDISDLENNIQKSADYELIVNTTIEPKRIKKVNIDLSEASGYIPSEKEKNDPRFKTALTVDVKPNSIKKNAKAFGWKISRDGKPPLLRK